MYSIFQNLLTKLLKIFNIKYTSVIFKRRNENSSY